MSRESSQRLRESAQPAERRKYLLEEMDRPEPLAKTEFQKEIYHDVLYKLSMEQLLSLHEERNFFWEEVSAEEYLNTKPLVVRSFIEWMFDEANDIFMNYYNRTVECKDEYIDALKEKLGAIDDMKQTIMTPPIPPPSLWKLHELMKYRRLLKKYNQLIDKMKDVLDIEAKIIESLRYLV